MQQLKRALLASLLLVGACGGSAAPQACRAPMCLPESSTYAVEVTATGTDSLPAAEFSAIALDTTTGTLTLQLPQFAEVSGHVLANGIAVPGTVVFSRPSRILGRPDVYYQATVDAQGAYTVEVPPNDTGEVYSVHMQPTDPSSFVPLATTASVASDTTLDLPLPTGTDLFTLHGSLTDAVKAAVGEARVVLRDTVTGADLSTTATTTDDGLFQVSLPATAAYASGSLLLVIQRGDATSGLLTVSAKLTASQLGTASTDAELMQLQLPALPAATHLTFTIQGVGTSGTTKLVAGATIQLTSTLNASPIAGLVGTSVTHEVDGQSATDGTFSADLFSDDAQSRTYHMTVVPPADSEFASIVTAPQTIVVGAANGYVQPTTLVTRPLLAGRVLDASGAALKGALLQPSASFVTRGDALAKPASSTTDGNGRFKLPIDPNVYDLGISPPASAALPRTWISRQSITGDLDLGDVALSSPVTFDALVRGSDQAPVAATVRLYVVPTSDPTCTACTPTPLLQAEGATGKDGRASLLLPAK